jgi:ribosomal protein S18 acetylase RimI-like enzyme
MDESMVIPADDDGRHQRGLVAGEAQLGRRLRRRDQSQDVAGELEDGRSEAYFATALTDERKTILVAEEHGQVIGYVQFGEAEVDDIDLQPGDRELHRVYVDTTHQRRGVGRRLTKAAPAHPRLADANRVFLQVWDANERAISLYASLGFKRIGTTRFLVGNEEMEDAVYVRDNRASNHVGHWYTTRVARIEYDS